MKYKVGDKVLVRNDLEELKVYGSETAVNWMVALRGKVVTIAECLDWRNVYKIKEEGGNFHWTDEMFEGLANEAPSITKMPKFKPKTKVVFTEDYRVAFGCVRKNTKGEVLGIGKIGDDDFYYSIAIGDERKKAHIPVENMDKVCIEDKTQDKHNILNGLLNSDGSVDGEKLMKKLESQNDSVNHPSHYTDGKIEVIDFIEDKKLGYHLGNACKYICRAGKKDPAKRVEDLRKAIWYVNRQAEIWEREQE